MKPGEGSRTAVLVCLARALADQTVQGFSDPTALALLPPEERDRAERFRNGPPRRNERGSYEFALRRAAMMAVRTLFIDEVVREAAPAQVVILGAGLDGRAWRLSELRDAVVFEVDHPDTQRPKRERVAALTQAAREVRFVPVDFTRDDLGRSLEAAGHDPARPTFWIWEGVVMYLSEAEVEASLRTIQERSAPASRLVIAYIAPGGLIVRLVGLMLRRMGEPIRSTYRREVMAALLSRHGFSVLRDESVPEAAPRLAPSATADARRIRHLRMVSAERRG